MASSSSQAILHDIRLPVPGDYLVILGIDRPPRAQGWLTLYLFCRRTSFVYVVQLHRLHPFVPLPESREGRAPLP